MKPPRQFILWYFHGIDQRILHEGLYPGTLALRLGALTYVGTADHEAYEVGTLSVPPTDELCSALRRDEFFAASGDDEFAKTVEAFTIVGLFREVSIEELVARGLDPSLLPGRLMVMDRHRLAALSMEFGSVRRRAEELLGNPHDYLPQAPEITPAPTEPTPPAPA